MNDRYLPVEHMNLLDPATGALLATRVTILLDTQTMKLIEVPYNEIATESETEAGNDPREETTDTGATSGNTDNATE